MPRARRVNHRKELNALLRNRASDINAIIAKANLAFTAILPDEENYDDAFIELASELDRKRPGILNQISPDNQSNVIRSLYVNKIDLNPLSEGMHKFFANNIVRFKPNSIDDFLALCEYQESEACDVAVQMAPDADYINMQDHVLASIPQDHLLAQILAEDSKEAFRALIKLDKLSVNEDVIANLAINHLEFLNELFIEKYKDDPEPFKEILVKINLRGNGAALRQHIDSNGQGLDADFLNITRKVLQSGAEKDHEDKTAVAIKKLEQKRAAIKEDIEDTKRPTIVNKKNCMNQTTMAGAVIGVISAVIAVTVASYIAAAALLIIFPLISFIPKYHEARHEQRVHDLEKDEKFKKVDEVNKEIKEQRDLLPDHSDNKKDKSVRSFQEVLGDQAAKPKSKGFFFG